ncbi:PPK2 family polyphosphate kinase [Leucobacter ruminantium]|uniref:Polyphosphate kinase 2 family protein n=1 Tax=Leucobacter ruminantium TaxID=1289170 RepID=A0A939LWC7_9MICO|nr:PPK2 family polyphosphate kinase [Leucobacter ruminantium]MBO1805647.1 polyphosphate kinase 2 family protein [Leucobacter ruminantium]
MSAPFWSSEPDELLRVGPDFRLRSVDPGSKPGTDADREAGRAELARASEELRELQQKLFAQSRTGARDRLLVVLQAMDAAGKGGIVNHVFGALEPYGLALAAFKAPSAEEREHDFLWRVEPRVPGPGVIGVFDRSHYEDVIVQRVRSLAPPEEIERRYEAIAEFERRIADDGVRIVKIMLHISPEEQAERLLARLDEPEKHWKYDPGDVDERLRWAEYMEAFQAAIDRTNAPHAPWFVVPADAKWYARVAVQRIVLSELHGIDPRWPAGDFDPEEQRSRVERTLDLRWP